jgi:hypothetical protein
MAAAASSSFAAINDGSTGNGELFLSVWNDNGSYTRDLGISINDMTGTASTTIGASSLLGQAGLMSLVFAADNTFSSYLTSVGAANLGSLKFSVIANDVAGIQRQLTTFSALPAETVDGTTASAGLMNVTSYLNEVNPLLGDAQSMVVNNGSVAWAGKDAFGDNMGGVSNFSNAGTLLGNNSAANGLNFQRLVITTAGAVSYNPLTDAATDPATPVKVWFDASNALHIAAVPAVPAVPEPSEYAMLLAGLGMLAAVARRNKRA